MTQPVPWNDLQDFLAIARSGQLARAAAAMGVDATTIGRRLRRLEARLGRTLHDVRDPRPDIPVGTGRRRAGKRLLTVGTDCSVGKMYTTLCLARALQARGRSADVKEGIGAFLEKRPARFPDRVSRDMPDFFPWADEPPFA